MFPFLRDRRTAILFLGLYVFFAGGHKESPGHVCCVTGRFLCLHLLALLPYNEFVSVYDVDALWQSVKRSGLLAYADSAEAVHVCWSGERSVQLCLVGHGLPNASHLVGRHGAVIVQAEVVENGPVSGLHFLAPHADFHFGIILIQLRHDSVIVKFGCEIKAGGSHVVRHVTGGVGAYSRFASAQFFGLCLSGDVLYFGFFVACIDDYVDIVLSCGESFVHVFCISRALERLSLKLVSSCR